MADVVSESESFSSMDESDFDENERDPTPDVSQRNSVSSEDKDDSSGEQVVDMKSIQEDVGPIGY